MGSESHVYVYEAGGMSVLGGVAFNVLPTQPNGELALRDVAAAVRCARARVHTPASGWKP